MADPPTPSQCIEAMKNGASILKCTKKTRHFRHFQLSPDLKRLTWKSPTKDSNGESSKFGFASPLRSQQRNHHAVIERSVVLQSIKGILVGQKTPLFKKQKLPEYEHVSFSVLYSDKTLDIICKDTREYEIWFHGLKSLCSNPDSLPFTEADSKRSYPSLSDSLEISFKGKHTVVVKREDTADVYSWGNGQGGRLGHGNELSLRTPKLIESLLGKDVISISCGASHSAALTMSGEVFTWGSGLRGKLGQRHDKDCATPSPITYLHGTTIIQVACGDTSTLFLTDIGAVYSSGNDSHTPRHLSELGEVICSIATGTSTFAAVSEEGQLFMWGNNDKYQLGLGDTLPRTAPAAVGGPLRDVAVSKVACGVGHTVALDKNGALYSWGDGSCGKLGMGDKDDFQTTPGPIPPFSPVIIDVACGHFHSCCISENGNIYTWGEGQLGQLGQGAAVTQYSTPLQVVKLSGIKIAQIACGSTFTAAATDGGEVYTWGYGAAGRLGHGEEDTKHEPALIAALAGKLVQGLAAGESHMAVMVVHGWVPDHESLSCMSCRAVFTTIRRRHHCRKCGGLFCNHCSTKRVPLLNAGISEPVRVCERCYSSLISKKP